MLSHGGKKERCFRNCSSNREVVGESGLYTSFQPDISESFTNIIREVIVSILDVGMHQRKRVGSI